jgi:hypothetical protein
MKKRDVYLLDKETGSSKSFFMGGYGLKLESDKKSNNLITVANELVDTVSSVRFYNKRQEKFEYEFYYKEGKILDFLNIEDASIFVLSLTNNSIVFYDYKDRPEFIKIIEINSNSLSRKLINKDKILYFATDNGEVYKYDYHNYSKSLMYDAKALITQFEITQDELIYTTIEGKIVKVNLNTGKSSNLELDNNFISALLLKDDQLYCGSWNGSIYVIDLKTFTIIDELNIHKRAVLKVKHYNNNFYSSSLDKTIKSWSTNKTK